MSRTLLIIENDPKEFILLKDILEGEYNILSAENVRDGLNLLRAKYKIISAIVLSVENSDKNSLNAIKYVRENVALQTLPILALQKAADDNLQEKILFAGANAIIGKPYKKDCFLSLLQNTIKLRETTAMLNTYWRDKLTGLLNREAFFTEADRLIKRREPGYFVMCSFDVENFKIINDQYGTEKGDEVLRYIANCIGGFFSGLNGLTCRFSADKFGILFPSAFMDSEEVAENRKLAMSPPCINNKIRIRTGRYIVNDFSLPVSAMFDRAALAEKSIRARYDIYTADFNQAMVLNLVKEQEIVNCMVDALKEGEFEIFLQPQYNHATGAIVGAEALSRWKRNGVYVMPSEYIPVFERNGFIYELDRYIWEEVCKLLRRYLDEGREPLPISVNISRRDLFHRHFIEIITGIVTKYEIPYELLRLEVTESAFSESSKTIITKVDQLISLGFIVEIDDFGSGYSSLNTLKDVPAAILKMDMRFLESSTDSQRGGNIIESVVRMARRLGMAVIAEGVEEKAQADFLKSIGCYYVQGFYYAKPMPIAEYERLMDNSAKEAELTLLKTVENLDNNEFWNPKSMETLIFNSYVGGACIFEYVDGKLELLRVNRQYAEELGHLTPGSLKLDEMEMVRYLDKENTEKLFNNLKNAIKKESESSTELYLSDPENPSRFEYIRTTARVITRDANRYLFYCVIVNITEQRVAEMKRMEAENANIAKVEKGQRELLDNLPCGAALYKYDGKKLTVVHINKKYWQLVGRESEDYADGSVMDAVHPDDKALLRNELEAAIRQNRDVVCDVRIRYGEYGYRTFCIIAVIKKEEDGTYFFYTSYTPVSDRTTSISEMIPVALSTMTSNSNDSRI